MDDSTLIKRNPKLMATRLDQEVVMMDLDTGTYFNLNETGTRIWDLLGQSPLTVAAIAAILTQEYEVDPATCKEETARFVADLVRQRILVSA